MQEPGRQEKRFDIGFFDGVNSAVQNNLVKRTELAHAENARAPIIGLIEKREGQRKHGANTNNNPFVAQENYGLSTFENDGINNQLFRVCRAATQDGTLSISVFDNVFSGDYPLVGSFTPPNLILVVEDITISEPIFYTLLDGDTVILDGTSNGSSIYYLSTADQWTVMSDSDGQNIIGGRCDFTKAQGNLIIVNGKDYNRYIQSDGTTVVDSVSSGHLFNSPRARKVAFYKNRIYLADYLFNGVRYKTSIVRSSYPSGIISLVNGDHTSISDGATVSLTDLKYIYSDSGGNTYDIYRGSTLISTMTVTAVNETSVVANFNNDPVTLLSSDEVWVAGTYSGEKQFRWVNNPTSFGKDVKQYDTFRLSGGEEDPITLLEPIGNVLMIANKNAMMTWNDYTLESFDLGVGCVSPTGYTKLLGKLYFMHDTGVYFTSGGLPTLLSRKIERYISGATRSGLENSAAGVKGLSVFFTIGDVTLYKPDGSIDKTLKDVCLEYATADKNWYVHTNVPADQFERFVDTAGTERLLFEHSEAGHFIKEFLNGNTDDGAEIFFRADIQEIQFIKEIETYATPISIITDMERGASVQCFVAPDEKDYYRLDGMVVKGISNLKINSEETLRSKPITCRKMKISYRDSSKQRCRITQVSVVYLPTAVQKA